MFRTLIALQILFTAAQPNAQLSDFSVKSVHNFIVQGRGNCSKVIDYYLERAYRYNPMLNALITFNGRLKAEALQLDDYYWKNRGRMKGRLHCVPLLVKDNVDVNGMPTTGGIRALRYSIPNRDALVIKRLRDEGGLIVAKTNLAEMAAGERYDSEMGGICKNPYDLEKSCGTSSTGTGASVASGMGVIGVGTDTTGSILSPSTFNGLWGLRPPIDLSVLEGVLTFSNLYTIDAVGPMTKHLDDLILAYNVMQGEHGAAAQKHQLRKIPKDQHSKHSIGMIKEFNSYFKLSLTIGEYEYRVEDVIKRAHNDTVNILSGVAKLTEISLSQDDVDEIQLVFEALIDDRCLPSCSHYSLNTYFSDATRFGVDAPYKTFDEFSESPLLSRFWANFFRPPIGVGENTLSPEQLCAKNCQQFMRVRDRAEKLVDGWLARANSATMLLTPAISKLNYENDQSHDPFVTLIPVFTVAGYAALSMPVGFYESSSYSNKKEMPVGMLLWTRLSLDQVFSVARHFDSRSSRNGPRVPQSTPLFETRSSSTTVFIHFNYFLIIITVTSLKNIF